MNLTNTTLPQELNQVNNNWIFTEVWIDAMLTPPYILLLLANNESIYNIYDPAKNYEIIFSTDNYDTAKTWLLEDEYEPLEGKLFLEELL